MPNIKPENKKYLPIIGLIGLLSFIGAAFLIGGNIAYNNEVTDIYTRAKQIEEQQNKAKLDGIKQGLEDYYLSYNQYPANLTIAGLDLAFEPTIMEYRVITKDKYVLRMQLLDSSYYDLSN